MKLETTVLGLAFATSLLALAGCSAKADPVKQVDQTVDCNDICNRYKNCYDADYNVSECTGRCNGFVDAEEANADRADICDKCFDNVSCIGAPFNCSAECAGIVPN